MLRGYLKLSMYMKRKKIAIISDIGVKCGESALNWPHYGAMFRESPAYVAAELLFVTPTS